LDQFSDNQLKQKLKPRHSPGVYIEWEMCSPPNPSWWELLKCMSACLLHWSSCLSAIWLNNLPNTSWVDYPCTACMQEFITFTSRITAKPMTITIPPQFANTPAHSPRLVKTFSPLQNPIVH
jgi:hypothetical protein